MNICEGLGRKMLITLGLIMATTLIISATALYGRPKKVPDKIEVIGPFEVVTHTSRFVTGWNEGQPGNATSEHYSLRYRGKLFAFEGRSGWFGLETKQYEAHNSIITFPSPKPAVVVNVGDPNNSSFYYLVREEGGKAVAQYLGESTGGVSASWLDPPADQALKEKSKTVHRRHLAGGRWLLLGELTVLDTANLKNYPLQAAENFSINNFKPSITMSPEQRSFVRFGSSNHGSHYPMLAVFEIESGSSYTLPIHRSRMRYNDWVEIDIAWFDHHFEWKKAKDGHFRLLERAQFTPLPYSGRLMVYEGGNRDYNLKPVKPEMRDRFIAFLENEYGARIQPRRSPHSSSDAFLIGQKNINVYLYEKPLGIWTLGIWIDADTDSGIWIDKDTDIEMIEGIAKKFDEVLATRKLDDLFDTTPSDRHVPPASATGRAGNFRATVVLTEDDTAFQAIWYRPATVKPPPIRTLNDVTIGKRVSTFVLISGSARNAKGEASVEATFDIVRPDGSIVLTGNDIPLWNALAPPETHLEMAQTIWRFVFDEEDLPGTYRIQALVCDQIAENCVELSLPFELKAP